MVDVKSFAFQVLAIQSVGIGGNSEHLYSISKVDKINFLSVV
jgi:hypothetical protein